MKLLGHVLFMAVCLFSVYALPNYNERVSADGLYQVMLAQVRSVLIDTRALSPAEASCAENYNNSTQSINTMLTNQTNACFETANKTLTTNNQSSNASVISIRNNLQIVQNQLTTCLNMTISTDFLNCTTSSFDSNLKNLDEANSKAFLVQAELTTNNTVVEANRDACVSAVIGTAKTNLTEAANNYNICLRNIKNQRSVAVELIKPTAV